MKPNPLPSPSFFRPLSVFHLLGIVILFAVISSLPVLQGSGREMNYISQLIHFLGHFCPPDFSILPETLEALGETLQIAVMATLFSVALSIPLGIAGAQKISPRWLVRFTRFILNAIRTVPGLIWALIGVSLVGANPLAGVIGLAFYSTGYLAKFFCDTLEAIDLDVSQGLKTLGADRLQSFQWGIWPQAKIHFLSHALWMFEYNIRSASIIGYVGAGGLGIQLHTYQEYYDWPKFAAVLMILLIVVMTLDFLGEKIRKTLKEKTTPKTIRPSQTTEQSHY
jgi:phosphonate transport system permease protein